MGNVSVYGTQGVHILLEPNDNPTASAYQKALL